MSSRVCLPSMAAGEVCSSKPQVTKISKTEKWKNPLTTKLNFSLKNFQKVHGPSTDCPNKFHQILEDSIDINFAYVFLLKTPEQKKNIFALMAWGSITLEPKNVQVVQREPEAHVSHRLRCKNTQTGAG